MKRWWDWGANGPGRLAKLGGSILDGRGEGGRPQKLDGQEENRSCDETMKSGWRQAGGSHVAIRAQEGQVLDPQLCHLGEQLVEDHPWGDQGKELF